MEGSVTGPFPPAVLRLTESGGCDTRHLPGLAHWPCHGPVLGEHWALCVDRNTVLSLAGWVDSFSSKLQPVRGAARCGPMSL